MNLGARVMKLVELQGSTRDENETQEGERLSQVSEESFLAEGTN
ncbi:hypothetical protein SEVCU111_0274 [Staphylococcus epidermidis VCU111]|nr:hypothetical protein SEVCU111_0274 [Staphylococcus epidermidis VCU111]